MWEGGGCGGGVQTKGKAGEVSSRWRSKQKGKRERSLLFAVKALPATSRHSLVFLNRAGVSSQVSTSHLNGLWRLSQISSHNAGSARTN